MAYPIDRLKHHHFCGLKSQNRILPSLSCVPQRKVFHRWFPHSNQTLFPFSMTSGLSRLQVLCWPFTISWRRVLPSMAMGRIAVFRCCLLLKFHELPESRKKIVTLATSRRFYGRTWSLGRPGWKHHQIHQGHLIKQRCHFTNSETPWSHFNHQTRLYIYIYIYSQNQTLKHGKKKNPYSAFESTLILGLPMRAPELSCCLETFT